MNLTRLAREFVNTVLDEIAHARIVVHNPIRSDLGIMGETIVVIGGGVSGLTTALVLSRIEGNDVTVVAKHMPGDYDVEYASPWAGANIMPMLDEDNTQIETRTWLVMKKLCEEVPEAGFHFQKCRLNRREKDIAVTSFSHTTFNPNPWFRNLFDDFRQLPKEDVLPGYDTACEYTSVCVNPEIYLPWMIGQLVKNNAVMKRATLNDIREAKYMSHTKRPATVIINATGLGARSLGGVEDTNMYPVRGQLVIVSNEMTPMLNVSGTEDGKPERMYMMQRAAGGGTILGGTYEVNRWESQPDPNIATRIMTRIVNAVPEIAQGKGVAGLDVIRHAVGLRPAREGGVRLENERLDSDTWIIHNYGHAGWGYQGSYGCAEVVVDLLNKIRETTRMVAKL